VLKVEIEDLANSMKLLKIYVPAEEVDQQIDAAVRQVQPMVRVPGFRPGKAPAELVERRYTKLVQEEAMKNILSSAYRRAIDEHNLSPINYPEFDVGDTLPERGVPFYFQARVEVRPEFTLTDFYKNMVIDVPKIQITEEQVEEVLQRQREEMAQYEPVEDRDTVRADDWILIDFQTKKEDKVLQKMEGSLVQLGVGVLAQEIENALVGMKVGEEKDIPISTEEGEVMFHVVIRGIKKQVLPELNDEFAKDVGGFESLRALREEIKHRLEEAAKKEQEEFIRRRIIEELVSGVDIELPPSLVEEELDYILYNMGMARVAAAQGKNLEEVREELRPVAERRVKASLIIDEIAKKEGIVVGEDEIKHQLEELTPTWTEEQRKQYLARGGSESIRFEVKKNKVMEFLRSCATINEVVEPKRIIVPGREKKGKGRIIRP